MQKNQFIILFLLGIYLSVNSQEISLKEIYKDYSFNPADVDGLKIANSNQWYSITDTADNILTYYFADATLRDTVFKASVFNKQIMSIYDYEWSSGDKYILIKANPVKLYRHSVLCNFFIYDVVKKKLLSVAEGQKLRDAQLSPDESKIAYVLNNNLYVCSVNCSKDEQLMKKAKEKDLIIGAPDWVYEEEFSLVRGFQWSPDSKKIAFLMFDQTEVKEYPLVVFKDENYPELYSLKYPKAGERNSKVSVGFRCFDSGKTRVLFSTGDSIEYIPRFQWTQNNNILSIVTLNRLQNHLNIILYNTEKEELTQQFNLIDKKYIEIEQDEYPTYINKDNDFLFISDMSGYNHIYRYSAREKTKALITSGNYDVKRILRYDQNTGKVYYSAAKTSPANTGIYIFNLNDSSNTVFNDVEGSHELLFSYDARYLIHKYTSVTEPLLVECLKSNGSKVKVLEDNEGLKIDCYNRNIKPKEFFTFETSEGVKLNGWVLKPSNFDPSKKYPLLLYVYGGPGIQTVTNEWKVDWFYYLNSLGYIVVSVDGRGTGSRGAEFKKCTYQNLGYYETIDQIETAKYFATQSYIDKDRVGVFGWSYGGYMAAMCILKGNDIFKTAISVAPVTHWKYYDNVYTERYMGLPAENREGYAKSSPITYVDSLKGNFLLIHGTADDNVHFQNTLALSKALTEANKVFEMQVYTDKDHSIRGGNTSFQLRERMTEFLNRTLLR